MFNPFPFIFVILELNFFLTVAHWGHEAKHKFLKKMLHIGDNVAHLGVAHWVHPVYEYGGCLFSREKAVNDVNSHVGFCFLVGVYLDLDWSRKN